MTPTRRNSLECPHRAEEMTMMTVNEVNKLTGVSIRTLQYYDTIGLLKPDGYTASGYRLYDDTALERLQQILLFKELEFPLKEIKRIIDAPDFDRDKALSQQIELLTMKKEHLEGLIAFARKIKWILTYLTQPKWTSMPERQKNNGDRLQNTRNMKKRQKISLPRHKKQHGKILCSFL